MSNYRYHFAVASWATMAGCMVLPNVAGAQEAAILIEDLELVVRPVEEDKGFIVERAEPAPEADIVAENVEVVAAAAAVVEAVDVAVPAPAQRQFNFFVPGVEADQLEPFLAQFRPVLQAELSLANRVCKFTDEQRTAAIVAGKAWLHDFVRDYVKNQGQQPQGIVFFGGVQRNANADPRRSIEDGVATAVKKIVAAEQYAAYEAELAHRREFYKEAAVENLVALIDQRLLLSAKQRKAIGKSLTSNWDDAWAPQLESLMHMGNYLPAIPDDRVTPHLSEEQITLWQGIQKVSFGHHFGANFQWIDGGQIIDDIDLAEGDARAEGDAAEPSDGQNP